jgi:hypothetical protein
MKILDHQYEGGGLREAHQQREDTTEELDLLELVVGRSGRTPFVPQGGEEAAEIGNGIGEFAGELGLLGASSEIAKGIQEGDVGKSHVSGLHAAADEDPSASPFGLIGEFGEQAGLTHTCVPGDERDRAPTLFGPIEQFQQAAEFLGPSNER